MPCYKSAVRANLLIINTYLVCLMSDYIKKTKMFKWLANFFTKTEKPDEGLGSSIYSNWTIQNTEHWMEYFNVESEAQANGSLDSPPTNSTSNDKFQTNIVAEFGKLKTIKKNEIQRQINSLAVTLGKLTSDQQNFNQLKNNAEVAIREVKTKNDNTIQIAQENLRSAKVSLTEFKRNNRLTRPAKPEMAAIQFWAILSLILVIETYINGTFLGANLSGSIAEGGLYALVASVINIAVGLFFAGFIKYINHVKTSMKFLGYIAISIWVTIVGIFNLFIGHFRDAVTADNGQGILDANRAIQTFGDNPFLLDEPQSYILAAIGVICAFIAMLDSYKRTDSYPSYGEKSKEYEKFDENLTSNKVDANKEQDDEIQKFIANGNKLISSVVIHVQNLDGTLRFIKTRIREDYPDYFDNLAANFKAIIQHYRSLNTEARDSQPPAYFNETVELSWRTLDNEMEQIEIEEVSFSKLKTSAENIQSLWPDIQKDILEVKKEY